MPVVPTKNHRHHFSHPKQMTGEAFRLFADEQGQDLIEYALLTTVVAFASIAVFDLIRAAIANAYGIYNAAANNNWYPPDP
jgi:Flp pilus assembly pilin Flp